MSILRIAALLAVVVAASAQTGAPTGAGPGSPGPLQTYDVPATGRPQTVYILRRVVKPGQNVGKHYHNGVEITQVIAGDCRAIAFEIGLNHSGHGSQVPLT